MSHCDEVINKMKSLLDEEMNKKSSDVRIVFLQRGNVLVGRFRREGSFCYLTNAYVIRNWGTKKGIGEIAKGGPTSNTILDATHNEVEYHELAEVLNIKCSSEAWEKKL